MDQLNDLISFLLLLIPIGGAMRIAACLVYMNLEEDSAQYKKRIKHVFYFIVLAECFTGIFKAVVSYYGGSVIT